MIWLLVRLAWTGLITAYAAGAFHVSGWVRLLNVVILGFCLAVAEANEHMEKRSR